MKYSNGWWAKVIILVTVFLVIGYFFVVALFSFSQITGNVASAITNDVAQKMPNAPSEKCRTEVLVWRKEMQEIMNYQMYSLNSWQDGNTDGAIEYYSEAANKYMAITSPTCDEDVKILHDYTGEELLFLGKSYKSTLIGDNSAATQYITEANTYLKKRVELFKTIDQRYNYK